MIPSRATTPIADIAIRLVRLVAWMAVVAFAFITLLVFNREGRLLIVEGSALIALGGVLALIALHFMARSKATPR